MSKELFKEGLKKYWVLPLILTVVLVLMVPAYVLMQKSIIDAGAISFQNIDETASTLENPVELNMEGAYKTVAVDTLIYSPYAMLIVLILPVVLGVQLFGNERKSKNRLADFIKEKKLTKESVYKTNIITGLIFSIMPIIVSALLLLVIKLFGGMGDYITSKTLINWTCLGIFSSMLFYVFTVLIGMITKNKPVQVLYTYGFLFIPIFMVYLFEIFMTKVIYGFPGFTTGFIDFLNQVPAIKVCQMFTTQFVNYAFANSLNLWYVLFYLIISVLIIFLGYKLLKVKNQEKLQIVGDKIFKYIWIFILGAFLYTGLMLIVYNPFVSILITVAVFLIIYILKEIISKKSFKAIKNGKRYYILAGGAILFVLIFSSDLFGYEKKVPNIDEVEYMTYTAVYPNGNNEVEFRTKENIQLLVDKHKDYILTKNTPNEFVLDNYTKVYLQYKLKNGKTMIRAYETILETNDLFQSEEYIKQKYAYMYDKTQDVDILKIAGLYNGKTFILEVNKYENEEILNKLISNMSNDLLNNTVHLPKTGEYEQYADKEGIQLLQVGILDGINQYTSYLYYLDVKDDYELVSELQKLIDEESSFINWEEE